MPAAYYGDSPGQAFASFQAYNEARARELQNAFAMLQRRNEVAAQNDYQNRALQYQYGRANQADAQAAREFKFMQDQATADALYRDEVLGPESAARIRNLDAQATQRELGPPVTANTANSFADLAAATGVVPDGAPALIRPQLEALAKAAQPGLKKDWDEASQAAEIGTRVLRMKRDVAPQEMEKPKSFGGWVPGFGWVAAPLGRALGRAYQGSPDTTWQQPSRNRVNVNDLERYLKPYIDSGAIVFDPAARRYRVAIDRPPFLQQPSAAGAPSDPSLGEMYPQPADPRGYPLASLGQTGDGYVPPSMGTNRMLNYGGQLPPVSPNVVMPGSTNMPRLVRQGTNYFQLMPDGSYQAILP
ncbi:MAG: hypothetical protein WC655_03535 [Candidatus Hydrogenedentales bacterium]|jgi:hypothetical protein